VKGLTGELVRTTILLVVAVLSATAGLGSVVSVVYNSASGPATVPHGSPSDSGALSQGSYYGATRPSSPLNKEASGSEVPESALPLATQWSVADTLVTFNNSLIPGNFPVLLNGAGVGFDPMAYDNHSGDIYVPGVADSLEEISETTNEVVALFEPYDTVQYLTSMVYDFKDNEIFTQYTGSPGTVAVTSAATNTLVTTISVGDVSEYDLKGLAYDSGTGEIFASNDLSSNVSVISTATDKVVDTINLPDQDPRAVAYDPGTHQIFVANALGTLANVSVISDATDAVVHSINVGVDPDAIVYDGGKGYVYVANGGSANVSVIDDSTDAVVTTIGLSAGSANSGAYDPAQNKVFFISPGGALTSNATVVSDASNTVVATILLDVAADGAAYDSDNNEVWVLNGDPAYASAISTATNAVVVNVTLTFTSRYWAYDSAHQEEFLADQSASEVAVVSDTSNHVVALIHLPKSGGAGVEPYRVVYDRGKGEVFTSDSAGGVGLSVINDTSFTVVKTIPLPGVAPTGMAYDPAKGEIFVGTESGSNVTIVNDTTDTIVGTISHVGDDPWSLAYDSGKGEIFVANLFGAVLNSNVTVINDTTDSIVARINIGQSPSGEIVYDSGKGEVFVPNYGSDNVSVISDATNTVVASIYTGTFAWGSAYDPAADEIFVGNFNGDFENITVISDVTDTTVGSIFPVGTAPSSLAFDPVTGDLYAGDSVDGTVAVIAPQGVSGAPHYTVTFSETGLPTGTTWDVTFNATLSSSTTSSIAYSVLNGSYTFSVGAVSGYTPAPASGPVMVAGAAQTISIVFSTIPPGKYIVTFTETGLPTGTTWDVTFNATLNSSTTNSIAYSVPNGSYTFSVGAVSGYVPTPSSGPVTVNGAPQTVTIVFTAVAPATYLVTFTETGLPTGTLWNVTLGGTAKNSTGAAIVFSEGNNSYSFTVGSVSGYSSAPSSGSVQVHGSPVSKEITFSSVGSSPPSGSSSGFLGLPGLDGYILLGIVIGLLVILIFFLAARRHKIPIVFAEAGLPPGTRWSVALDGSEQSAVVEEIMFTAHSGTHSYVVGSALGLNPSPASGRVELKRERIDVRVRFSPSGPKT